MKTPLEQLKEIAEKNKQVFKNEWLPQDHTKVNKALCKYFGGKVFINHRNENVLMRYDLEGLQNILGLPYTSTSSFAMLALDCNVHIKYPQNIDFYYHYVAMNVKGQIFLALCDNEENEILIKV